MSKTNKPVDVFKKIDMHNGDTSVCWEWLGSLNQGRPYFTVKGVRVLVYRLTYELVHGHEWKEGEVARHTCDNPQCCNPYHIEVGTHQDNMDDMTERSRHGVSAHTVRHIRKLVEQHKTDKEIGDIVGLARETVRDIRLGKRRQNMKED